MLHFKLKCYKNEYRFSTIWSPYSYKTIYKKTWTQNTQWKQRYRWKRYCSITRRNVRQFPPANGRMTPNSVCLWRHRKHGDSNERWPLRRFEPLQETGVKKMRNGNVQSKLISQCSSRLWFYDYKKYKNGNSARQIATQRHTRPSICYGGCDNFSSEISGKLPKIATSNIIFSRTADRTAAKLCMTIKKIKPNDIFQNCVHSSSTLRY